MRAGETLIERKRKEREKEREVLRMVLERVKRRKMARNTGGEREWWRDRSEISRVNVCNAADINAR